MASADVTMPTNTAINTSVDHHTQSTQAQQESTQTQQATEQMNPVAKQFALDRKKKILEKLYESQKEDGAKARNMQKFMAGQDSTGSEEGDTLHGKLGHAAGKMGLPHVSKSHVRNVAARVAGHPAHQELTHQVKLALQGQGPMPSSEQIAGAATKALNDTGGLAAGAPQVQGHAANQEAHASQSKAVRATAGAAAAAGAAGTAATQEPSAGQSTEGSATAVPQASDAASPKNLAAQEPETNAQGSATPLLAGESHSVLSKKETDKVNQQIQGLLSGKIDQSAVAGNVMGFVYAVMMQAQIDGNKDKREVLNHTKMLNGMMEGLTNYISNTLMPLQDQLTQKIKGLNDSKDKDASSKASTITVTGTGIAENMNTNYAPTDANTNKVVPDFQYSNKDGGRKALTQTALGNYIQLAQQWQTSIQNNQQKQTNRYQAVDSNQTSGMNILNSLLKNTHDAISAIQHNVAT